MWALLVNMLASVLLVFVFKVGFVGLAISTAMSAWSNALMLLIYMLINKQLQFNWQEGRLWIIVVADDGADVVGVDGAQFQEQWLSLPKLTLVLHLLFLVVVGLVVYGVGLLFSGVRLRHLKA